MKEFPVPPNVKSMRNPVYKENGKAFREFEKKKTNEENKCNEEVEKDKDFLIRGPLWSLVQNSCHMFGDCIPAIPQLVQLVQLALFTPGEVPNLRLKC